MTSETFNLHVSKNLNIPKTERDIEKLKSQFRPSGNVVLLRLKLDQRFFRCRGTLSQRSALNGRKLDLGRDLQGLSAPLISADSVFNLVQSVRWWLFGIFAKRLK